MSLGHFFDLFRGFHDFFDLPIWWAWIITLCILFHHSSSRVHCFIIYFFCKLCRGLLITFFTFFITFILIKLLINYGNRFYILKFIFKIQIYFNHGRFKWILRFNLDLIVDQFLRNFTFWNVCLRTVLLLIIHILADNYNLSVFCNLNSNLVIELF